MLEFFVPPGIGDISWLYSKLTQLARERRIGFRIGASSVNRSGPFVDLLPDIVNLGYGDHLYPYPHLSPDEDLSRLDDGVYGICANPYLEAGRKLQAIYSWQPTDYHYPLRISDAERQQAASFIDERHGRPRIGLYASSSMHRGEWSFWEVHDWLVFVQMLSSRYPEAAFYVIGAEYDDRTMLIAGEMARLKWNVANGVGRFGIGATIEVIRRLDYFFSFPSGLGILADVVNTPCLMWYPRWNKDLFIDTYADPVNVDLGRHLNQLYVEPNEAFCYFLARGEKWLLERSEHA